MTKRQVFQRFIVTALNEIGVHRQPWTVDLAICIFLPSCSQCLVVFGTLLLVTIVDLNFHLLHKAFPTCSRHS